MLFLVTPSQEHGGDDYHMLVNAADAKAACVAWLQRYAPGEAEAGDHFVKEDDGHVGGECFTCQQMPGASAAIGVIDWSDVPCTFWRLKPKQESARPVIRKFLDLSTGHLTLETREAIDKGHGPSTIYPHPGNFGWFMHVPNLDRQDPEKVVRADLAVIFERARQLGCDYVNLDCDAEPCPGLPWYDDDEESAGELLATAAGWARDPVDGVIRHENAAMAGVEYISWAECCKRQGIQTTEA